MGKSKESFHQSMKASERVNFKSGNSISSKLGSMQKVLEVQKLQLANPGTDSSSNSKSTAKKVAMRLLAKIKMNQLVLLALHRIGEP